MDEVSNVEEVIPSEDNPDPNATIDGKTKRNHKSDRRRLTGGRGILRNLTRRGSFGSFLYENFDPTDPIAMGYQELILKCQVQLTVNSLTRSRLLYLYKDVLICAKQKSTTNFHLKYRVNLRDIWLVDFPNVQDRTECASTNGKYLLGWPIVNAELEFLTTDDRNVWVTKLQEQLAHARENEPTDTIIRIVQNDEKYTVTKSLRVGNCETTKMVLSRCIQEFHIETGKPNNFQLYVSMNKNDLPIPLTGHEVLYRIQMKYKRDQQETDREASADNETEPNDGLVFHLISREKKSLVLKRTLTNDDVKMTKRPSPLARFFRMTLKLADDGRLYRRNLNELCKDGKLCWRLMMMLGHLFVNGPALEEVFRKPPALKIHRMLQERLDRGKDFNFEKVTACEMSHLLKSFLNYLPECLLTSQLYLEWAEIPRKEDKPAMIWHAKSLVARLPVSNRILLEHLICVLNRIASHHAINGMPPKSLSICIGQCLLWLPPQKLVPNNIANEVIRIGIANSVTEILIECAREIFGEDSLHLFDHLLGPPSLIDTNCHKENVCPSSNERKNPAGGLIRESTTAERSGITRSYSCVNNSAISLIEDDTDQDMAPVHDDNREVTLKLNSSWNLSGSGFTFKDLIQTQAEPSLQASHVKPFLPNDESRQINEGLLPESHMQHVMDSFTTWNSSETTMTSPGLHQDILNQSKLNFVENTAKNNPVVTELLQSISTEDNCLPSEANRCSQDKHQYTVQLTSKKDMPNDSLLLSVNVQSECMPTTDTSPTTSQLTNTVTDVESSQTQIFVFPCEESESPFLKDCTSSPSSSTFLHLESPEQSAQPPGLSPITKAEPFKTKSPQKLNQIKAPDEDNSATKQNVLNNLLMTNMYSKEADDGYSSPSINSITTSEETDRNAFDTFQSRFDNAKDSTSIKSPKKNCMTNELDENQNAPNTSGQNLCSGSSYGLLSSPRKTMEYDRTPPGIVQRLKSEILQRELSCKSPTKTEAIPITNAGLECSHTPPFKENVSRGDGISEQSYKNSYTQILSDNHSSQHSIKKPGRYDSLINDFNNDSINKSIPTDVSKMSVDSCRSGENPKFRQSEPLMQLSEESKLLKTRDKTLPDIQVAVAESVELNSMALTKSRQLNNKHDSSDESKQLSHHRPVSVCPSYATKFGNAYAASSLTDTNLTTNDRKESGLETASTHFQTNAPSKDLSGCLSDAQTRATKQRLHNSDPKIVKDSAGRLGIERSSSDTFGITSNAAQGNEKTMRENKENLSRYQQLKRTSVMRQISTPEKVSKKSVELVDEPQDTDDVPHSPDCKNISVKNRDWHKELTEQYMQPTPPRTSFVLPTKTAITKPCQRSITLAPKISFTPMPLRTTYQGNASRLSKTTDKSKNT